jgi:uncharacterized protein YciI
VLYAISATDANNSLALRRATREKHLAYVRRLLEDGALVLAGPHPAIDCADPGDAGYSGSLIIAEFASLEDAEAWARNDPYSLTGVFGKVSIKPFLQVMP